MNSRKNDATQSFWEHLDDLRACLIKIVLVVLVLGIAAFLFKKNSLPSYSVRKTSTSLPTVFLTK